MGLWCPLCQKDGQKCAFYISLSFIVIINVPSRSEACLDASSQWTTHAWRHQSQDKTTTIFLFFQGPPQISRVVQGHGTNHLRVWPLAQGWPPSWVHWPQSSQGTGQLLLPSPPLHPVQFHVIESAAPGMYQITWSFVQLLSQIPLWTKFHQAVLGCCKTLFPHCWPYTDAWCNGKDNVGVSWWHPCWTNSEVCHLFSFIPGLTLFADLQTGPRSLFPLIVKACPVPKLPGPTRSIMATAPSPLIWSCSWRRQFQIDQLARYMNTLLWAVAPSSPLPPTCFHP